MKSVCPATARVFTPATNDAVTFGPLTPLASGASWSVVASICPTGSHPYGAIVRKRRKFEEGLNQFTFWLKNGAVSVEVDRKSVRSKLIPTLHQWSIVGAAAGQDGTNICLGAAGKVLREHHADMSTGAPTGDAQLAIGRVSTSCFPGSIASVCLFKEKLSDSAMAALCTGKLSPLSVPSVAFAWIADESGDRDIVSGQRASVTGTRPEEPASTDSSNIGTRRKWFERSLGKLDGLGAIFK